MGTGTGELNARQDEWWGEPRSPYMHFLHFLCFYILSYSCLKYGWDEEHLSTSLFSIQRGEKQMWLWVYIYWNELDLGSEDRLLTACIKCLLKKKICTKKNVWKDTILVCLSLSSKIIGDFFFLLILYIWCLLQFKLICRTQWNIEI